MINYEWRFEENKRDFEKSNEGDQRHCEQRG